MRPWLLLLILLFSATSFAQQRVQVDSGAVDVRTISKQAIERYKHDKDFEYEQIREPVQSIWDRFWSWFWFKVNQVLSTKQGRATMWTVFVIFAVAMILFFVFKVMGMNRQGLFGRTGSGLLDYSVSEEDIYKISFDEAISEAIASGNYRLAIRLLYLQTLKKLSERGIINWQINKTNSDYLKEVAGHKWSPLFSSVTNNFDYIWYGEMPVDKEHFEEVRQQFTTLNNEL